MVMGNDCCAKASIKCLIVVTRKIPVERHHQPLNVGSLFSWSLIVTRKGRRIQLSFGEIEVPKTSAPTKPTTSISNPMGDHSSHHHNEKIRPSRYCVVPEEFCRDLQGWLASHVVQLACSPSFPPGYFAVEGSPHPSGTVRPKIPEPVIRLEALERSTLVSCTSSEPFPAARLRTIRFEVLTLRKWSEKVAE